MREQIEHARQVIVDAASNPKVALLTGVALPAASSAANKLEVFTTWTSAVTGTLAACTGAVVLAIQVLKLIREWRDGRRKRK
jgi:hypothetical protein